jgi:hypothetical protein
MSFEQRRRYETSVSMPSAIERFPIGELGRGRTRRCRSSTSSCRAGRAMWVSGEVHNTGEGNRNLIGLLMEQTVGQILYTDVYGENMHSLTMHADATFHLTFFMRWR